VASSFDVTAMAIDAAESIGAGNGVEKMLAHEMVKPLHRAVGPLVRA